MHFDWKDYSVGLFLLTLLVYWRTFKYNLVSDDIPGRRRVEELIQKQGHPMTYWQGWYWDFRGVYDIKRSHIISVVFHAVNTVLIYWAFGNPWAALLFMLNPITMMASVWISGRSYSIATSLALISWILPATAVICYGTAIYWSIAALFYPLVMGYQGWHWSWLALLAIPGTWLRFTRKKELMSLTPLKTVSSAGLVSLTPSKMLNESNAELRALAPRKLMIFIKTYGYYFRVCLFTHRLGLFHKFLYTFGLNKKENRVWYTPDREFFFGLLALGLTAYGILQGPFLVSLGLFWFFVNVGQWCNLITFNQQISERYLYLPVIGLMLALSQLLPTNILMLFVVYYFTRLWWFLPSLENEFWNVEYNVDEAKDLYYIWISRGVHRFAEGNFVEAIRNLFQAYGIKKDVFKTNINIFYIALVLGDLKLAEKHLAEAELCPIEGKEEEQKDMIANGRERLRIINEAFKKDGKCQIDFKDIQLLL